MPAHQLGRSSLPSPWMNCWLAPGYHDRCEVEQLAMEGREGQLKLQA